MSDLILKLSEPVLPALPTTTLPAISGLTASLSIPRYVLVRDEEIQYIWCSLPRELREIPPDLRGELTVRMYAAVNTGLFDGAMNHAWNAAILQLRTKIWNFDLPIVMRILQSNSEEKYLLELRGSRLLELALRLNLVNEDGFLLFDRCREVRNNFSTAHPTMGSVSDREFTTFLNRCIRYALAGASSPKGVDIGAFISAVKGPRFNVSQHDVWIQRSVSTHDTQRRMLVGMAHGIYCDPDTSEPSRLNALDIGSSLKEIFAISLRSDLVNKHSEYAAEGDEPYHATSLQFFEKLGLLTPLNESEQHAVFYQAIERLWNAYNGTNNFYNEPSLAERLLGLSLYGVISETAQEQFIQVAVCCNIGNGYGVCWAAATSYEQLIRNFSPKETVTMIRLASNNDSSLGCRINALPSCRARFKATLTLVDPASIPSRIRAAYDHSIKQQDAGVQNEKTTFRRHGQCALAEALQSLQLRVASTLILQ